MVLLLYRILFPLAFVVALPFYALRLWRRERGRASQAKPEGYEVGLGQRFGRYSPAILGRLKANPNPWWLCSISVGETLVALKLARELRAQHPDAGVVLSVTTSTGYEMLLREAAKLPWLVPLYNPIDFRFAGRSALRTIQPRALILIEGGIWPNLLDVARQRNVPIGLACARLSPRSERRWRKMPGAARSIWRLFDLVCVPEADDRRRFAEIGANPDRIAHTGNIKFDQSASGGASREAEFRALVEPLGFSGEIIVAGSTWAPEEALLAKCLTQLQAAHPQARLIVVPRHVERADEVEAAFAGLKVARRSRLPIEGRADVLLVDTTGELRDWYRLGTVIFVGKSMPGIAEVGGQNPGEPAGLGKAVVFGPHMENFAVLTTHLLKNNAAVQVQTADELCASLGNLLQNTTRREELERKAETVLTSHLGATRRTAETLSSLQNR
jgi:3-deoxy-D-manno-octulosonic-acid transferase